MPRFIRSLISELVTDFFPKCTRDLKTIHMFVQTEFKFTAPEKSLPEFRNYNKFSLVLKPNIH